jgi:hypothetical protein
LDGRVKPGYDAGRTDESFPMRLVIKSFVIDLTDPAAKAISDRRQTMNSQNFAVTGRPRPAEISEFPKTDFADYERRQSSLQAAEIIQQV